MHGILSYARFGLTKTDTTDKEKLKIYFDEIYDCGSRLMSLLNDLLDLAKLESGKTDYLFDNNDLVTCTNMVVTEMMAFALEKQVTLSLQTTSPTAHAYFDPQRISQVLRNLISNAIKFSFPNTSVCIVIEEHELELRCEVTNEGVGIPQEELTTIFDKFVQSSKTHNGAGGTGLGLAICKEIIADHQGEICVSVDASNITHFSFTVPVKKPEIIKAKESA